MNFNSLQYILFLALNVLLYYILPPKARNWLLLLSSYYFYMCWNPKYALLMLLSTVITYACGLLVSRSVWGRRRLWLALSFISNLSILFFFKYYNFVSSLFNRLSGMLGLGLSSPLLDVLLPVGISFYTFQALGYTMDVYRGDVPAERNFADYALFVSFFPQLVAGPIERSGNILHQLKETHSFSIDNLRDGALPVLWGLFKKMVLADNLAVVVNTIYNSPSEHTGPQLILATGAFAIQIFCDFSSYSDIARGSARMLGFDLMENFRCPYFATSIQDFWRRWHISLSSWFKDYLYFPLGGSRRGKARRILNLLIVFTVSGLWHGAALTFVAWGLLNGLYQAVSILLRPLRDRLFKLLHVPERAWWLTALRVLFTFSLTCLAWVLFRANSLTDAMAVYSAVFRWMANIPRLGLGLSLGDVGISKKALLMLGVFSVGMLGADWFICNKDLWRRLNGGVVLRYAVYFLLMVFILIFGSYGSGYDPQDFVYFQF
jgi:D-alanyl-lipoteichoic acid acyltransferase DltB (MBOAT superfamily)